MKILNKTETAHEYQMHIDGLNNYKWHGPQTVQIAAGEVLTLPISVAVDPVELKRPITKIDFIVTTEVDGETVEAKQESRFFGP